MTVHTSTNGHFFTTKEHARRLIESGLDSLVVAVDGLDQLTYEKYREGGRLDAVLSSIKNVVSERAAAGVEHPRITFRFMVMRHNEHQIDQVEDFAERLGVDAVTFRSAVVRRGNLDLEETITPFSHEFRQYDFGELPEAGLRLRKPFSCHRPYANLTVFSNGDVVICENDYNVTAPLGNVSDQSLNDIVSSSRCRLFLRAFRRNLDQFRFCRECEFRGMKNPTVNVRTHILRRSGSEYEEAT